MNAFTASEMRTEKKDRQNQTSFAEHRYMRVPYFTLFPYLIGYMEQRGQCLCYWGEKKMRMRKTQSNRAAKARAAGT